MILSELRQLLEAKGIRPLKRFGQNFLFDPNQQRWIVARAAELAAGAGPPGTVAAATGADGRVATDTMAGVRVLEIGPGPGCLTEHLLAAGADVLAVEIDRGLAEICRERFADQPRFRLIETDALEKKSQLAPALVEGALALQGGAPFPPGHAPLLVVANLPYQIAVPLILLLWTDPRLRLSGMVVTVQKEVADRLAAAPGDDDKAYGPPSVILGTLTEIEKLKVLGPQCFWPAPQIDSAVIRLRPKPDRALPPVLQCGWPERAQRIHAWSQFMQELFQQRRKTVRKALQNVSVPGVAAQSEIRWDRLPVDPQARAEQLTPDALLGLWLAFSGIGET